MNGGIYFVTASTYHRQHLFDDGQKLDLLTGLLIDTATTYGWQLRAWSVFSNHYHFMADSPEGSGESLRAWLTELHRSAAVRLNQLSESPGRRVWMNFRETRITYQNSYLARLRYVNENPVKHGLVSESRRYRWCSAAWFESHAPESFVASVRRFRIDRLQIWDEFD